jgi:hypothetical protein
MTAKVLAACAAAALIVCAGFGLWSVSATPTAPADLPALADAATAAGWRVVPVSTSNGRVEGGFFAVPADDPRGWEELSQLRVGEGGWRGVVSCLPMWGFAEPVGDLPVYTCRAYMLYGKPDDVRAFAARCGIE